MWELKDKVSLMMKPGSLSDDDGNQSQGELMRTGGFWALAEEFDCGLSTVLAANLCKDSCKDSGHSDFSHGRNESIIIMYMIASAMQANNRLMMGKAYIVNSKGLRIEA